MTIKNGKNGIIMGSFKEILSDSEIQNIIAYLRNEAKNQNTENNSSDSFYPNGNNLRATSTLNYIVPEILLDNSAQG